MANPQLENGFTRIANELMEAIPRYKFNGTQLRILFVVLRYTYGFQRKSHELSLTFIANNLDTNKQQVKRELDKLIESNVLIEKSAPSFNKTREIQFNKNYNSWLIDTQYANKSTVSVKGDTQYTNKSTVTVSELEYQERKKKENFKDSSMAPPLYDENLERISKAHRENGFGPMFPNAGQALLEMAEEYTVEWVEMAMQKAGEMNKRNIRYVKGILKGWQADGEPNMGEKPKQEEPEQPYFKRLPEKYDYGD